MRTKYLVSKKNIKQLIVKPLYLVYRT